MELGGNIRLEGFGELPSADMVIVKKLVGSYIKEISDGNESFKEFVISMKHDPGRNMYDFEAHLHLEEPYRSNATGSNLFFGINDAFVALNKQLK